MRKLLISLTAVGLLGSAPTAAQGTPDRGTSFHPMRAAADGPDLRFGRMSRFHDQPGAWRDGGKRCPTCRVHRESIVRESIAERATPEPGAAILFALGALAVQAGVRRRLRVR